MSSTPSHEGFPTMNSMRSSIEIQGDDSPGPSGKTSTPCRYLFRSGTCRRGEKCWYSHEQQRQPGQPGVPKTQHNALEATRNRLSASASPFKPLGLSFDASLEASEQVTVIEEAQVASETQIGGHQQRAEKTEEDRHVCGICMEAPSSPVYAHHINCDHSFCVPCLKSWRAEGRDGVHKACPSCRTESLFTFVARGPLKGVAREMALNRFKDRCKATPCKHFTKSTAFKNKIMPFCIFGDDCLYRHQKDGKLFKFNEGIQGMKERRNSAITGTSWEDRPISYQEFLTILGDDDDDDGYY